MSIKRNIILIDFDASPKWEMGAVLSEITKEDWNIAKCVTNKYHKNKFDSLKRIFLYFFFPLTIVIKRKKYDKIIGWQQFFGLNIAFWCRLFRLKKRNDITIMTFIYKKKNGIIGTIYHKYMSYILSSKYIDRIICYSKNECKYYLTLRSKNLSSLTLELHRLDVTTHLTTGISLPREGATAISTFSQM